MKVQTDERTITRLLEILRPELTPTGPRCQVCGWVNGHANNCVYVEALENLRQAKADEVAASGQLSLLDIQESTDGNQKPITQHSTPDQPAG